MANAGWRLFLCGYQRGNRYFVGISVLCLVQLVIDGFWLVAIVSPHVQFSLKTTSVSLTQAVSHFKIAGREDMVFNLQKAGGIAALFEAVAYIVGFGVMATLLNPGNTEGWTAAQKLVFVLDNKALFQTWTLFIYVAFGIALVVLAVVLHDRLKLQASDVMKIATPFGFIWAGLVIASGMVASVGLEAVAALHQQDIAQSTSSWTSIVAIQNGGVEVVGGIWVLLISTASFRAIGFPRALGYLGIFVGVAGILTVVPVLKDLAIVFGISQILWFAWIGIVLLGRVES